MSVLTHHNVIADWTDDSHSLFITALEWCAQSAKKGLKGKQYVFHGHRLESSDGVVLVPCLATTTDGQKPLNVAVIINEEGENQCIKSFNLEGRVLKEESTVFLNSYHTQNSFVLLLNCAR
ncbi:unnamed protein product [Lepidochelys kempii]